MKTPRAKRLGTAKGMAKAASLGEPLVTYPTPSLGDMSQQTPLTLGKQVSSKPTFQGRSQASPFTLVERPIAPTPKKRRK